MSNGQGDPVQATSMRYGNPIIITKDDACAGTSNIRMYCRNHSFAPLFVQAQQFPTM
jgi:hypothetical protein